LCILTPLVLLSILMAKNVLVSGIRRVGKTTLVKRLAHDLSMLVIGGFHKEEIIEDELIKGFRIVSFDYNEQILAHVYIEGPDRIDNYGVNVEGFENFVLPQFSNLNKIDLVIFDEVGKMECMSRKFCQLFQELLETNIPVVATYSRHSAFKFKDLKKRKDTTFLQMNMSNRDNLWKQVLLSIE